MRTGCRIPQSWVRDTLASCDRTIRDGIIFSKDLHSCFLVTPMGEDLLSDKKKETERGWAIIYECLSSLTVSARPLDASSIVTRPGLSPWLLGWLTRDVPHPHTCISAEPQPRLSSSLMPCHDLYFMCVDAHAT